MTENPEQIGPVDTEVQFGTGRPPAADLWPDPEVEAVVIVGGDDD